MDFFQLQDIPLVELIVSAAAALLLMAVHVFTPRLTFLEAMPRSRLLSASGGAAVAYIFVHLLPELSEAHGVIKDVDVPVLRQISKIGYLLAMTGLALFYGLERLVQRHRERHNAGKDLDREDQEVPIGVFRIHIGSFAVYNLLIGYLLVRRDRYGWEPLVLFGVAMALHFLAVDHGMFQHHGPAYRRYGRWTLAAALALGWGVGMAVRIPHAYVMALFAFLAGSVVLNVLKEELPEYRRSRFWPFAAGAAGYAAIIVVFG